MGVHVEVKALVVHMASMEDEITSLEVELASLDIIT